LQAKQYLICSETIILREWNNELKQIISWKALRETKTGVGNLRHAWNTWHAKQFPVAWRSSNFYTSILLSFTQKVHWLWLVWKY